MIYGNNFLESELEPPEFNLPNKPITFIFAPPLSLVSFN